jgi:hypothetical protein
MNKAVSTIMFPPALNIPKWYVPSIPLLSIASRSRKISAQEKEIEKTVWNHLLHMQNTQDKANIDQPNPPGALSRSTPTGSKKILIFCNRP